MILPMRSCETFEVWYSILTDEMKFQPWANHDIMTVQSIRNSCLFCGTFHFFSLFQHLVSCVFIWQTLILDLLENREREVPICSAQILPRKKGAGTESETCTFRESLLTCTTNIEQPMRLTKTYKNSIFEKSARLKFYWRKRKKLRLVC